MDKNLKGLNIKIPKTTLFSFLKVKKLDSDNYLIKCPRGYRLWIELKEQAEYKGYTLIGYYFKEEYIVYNPQKKAISLSKKNLFYIDLKNIKKMELIRNK